MASFSIREYDGMTPFTMREFDDGSIEWRIDGKVPYWRRASGEWVIHYRTYRFKEWLDRVELPDDEKVMLKLRFG